MAKDERNRGGRRVKSGSKPDSLTDKMKLGRPAKVFEPPAYDIDDSFETDDLMEYV